MTECISFVERLGRKTTIVKFFTAGASGYYRWVISHYGRRGIKLCREVFLCYVFLASA
jgi:hypothetical protein